MSNVDHFINFKKFFVFVFVFDFVFLVYNNGLVNPGIYGDVIMTTVRAYSTELGLA